ncbi:MAG: PH domain-containing protein, partial [Candidatus Pacebacteria bacterium]|nr:PH domain-containing protein [Candidatus Paceibacterota bacterium]
ERIIDIDFLSLIYKNVSAAKIDKVEDITAVTSGVAQSIFDYGTVHIQTAAEKSEFEFEDVPHPNRVTQFLNEMLVEEEKEKIEGRVK